MMRTYKAILHGDHVEWLEDSPGNCRSVQVYVTVAEEAAPEQPQERGRAMAEALAELAKRGAFASITDPVAWQRDIRGERGLPDRES